MIRVKRIYDSPSANDGFRILVDRLWPRGVSKAKGHVGLWMRDIAPSDRLRKWFGHEPQKWEAFKSRYQEELKGKTELIRKIKDLEEKQGTITLLYGAADTSRNNAVALSEFLRKVGRRD